MAQRVKDLTAKREGLILIPRTNTVGGDLTPSDLYIALDYAKTQK